MKSAPLSIFVQGLVTGNNLVLETAEVNIVQDNCGQLSDRARELVRLAYRGSRPKDGSRWSTTVVKSENQKKKETNPIHEDLPHLPSRRASLEPGADVWKTSKSADKIPHLPPRCPAARSSLRWALALGDTKDCSDDESSTDSESESTCSDSELNFDDYESDDSESSSDWDSSDSELDSDSEDDESDSDYSSASRWDSQPKKVSPPKVNAHEWTFAPNTILPNMQEIFRKAAQDKDFDINKTMQSLTCASAAG